MIRTDQRIEFIELVEVGPFDHTRIEFPKNANKELAEVHIFTGGNGCGKTTLLYALASTFEHPHNNQVLKRFRGKKGQIAHGKFGERYLIGWDLSPSSDYPQVLYRQEGYANLAGNNPEWYQLIQKFNNGSTWKDIQFSILPLAYSGQRLQQRTSDNLAIREIQNSPLENHLGFGNAINPQLITQWIANVLAKESFALTRDKNELKAKQLRSSLDRVIQAIRDIAGEEFDFVLNTTTLDVAVNWRGIEQSMDLLPDGLKSIVSWLTDVLMRMDRLQWVDDRPVTDQPLILFLDEVDIHLHPKWQRKILPVIQKLFRNAQIFVSTHSPFVVGSVQDAWVYKLDTSGEVTHAQSQLVPHVAEEKATYNSTSISSIPLQQVQAIPSGAGTSYEVLLEEIFEVSEHYDVDTQKMLSLMKQERDLLLSSPNSSPEKFIELASTLAARSEELDGIVALELRQLAKHGRRVVLAVPTSTN
jgi:energy-coupling factor transporter ATP-binding protein EcfA2